MGRASRAKIAATLQANMSGRVTVYWARCRVCTLDHPTIVTPSSAVEPVTICQRCFVADITKLMRELPGTVAMLPTVRALQGKRPVILEGNADAGL